MAKLYELVEGFKVLEAMLYDGEIEQSTFNDTMESLEFELELKADNYAKLIKNIESDVNGLKTEEKRLAERRKAMENKVKWLKSNLETAMIESNNKKFKTDYFSFNVQKNPPRLEVLNKENIPNQYFIEQEPKLDTTTLKKAIKAGLQIDGVNLIQTEGLRIR